LLRATTYYLSAQFVRKYLFYGYHGLVAMFGNYHAGVEVRINAETYLTSSFCYLSRRVRAAVSQRVTCGRESVLTIARINKLEGLNLMPLEATMRAKEKNLWVIES
jgi:hypothetical protein